MIYRITDLGNCSIMSNGLCIGISGLAQFKKVVRAYMLQKQVKCLAMVVMTKVAKFVQKNIIPQRSRKPYYIKVEIDVVSCGTAAPVRGIMLDGNLIT